MLYLVPTKQYLERLTSVLHGGTDDLEINYIKVGHDDNYWDSTTNLPKVPNIFPGITHIQSIWNEGSLSGLAGDPFSQIEYTFIPTNLAGGLPSDSIKHGWLFKVRFQAVLTPAAIYWDDELERLVIPVVPTGPDKSINAIELLNGTTPLFLISIPKIQMDTGVIADWDLNLEQAVAGATEAGGS
jgi:hypothetical protein